MVFTIDKYEYKGSVNMHLKPVQIASIPLISLNTICGMWYILCL